jgi:hypothetical protein
VLRERLELPPSTFVAWRNYPLCYRSVVVLAAGLEPANLHRVGVALYQLSYAGMRGRPPRTTDPFFMG